MVTLEGQVTAGTEPIYFQWQLPDGSIVYQPRLQLSHNTLMSGIYTQTVTNQFGNDSQTFNVTVLGTFFLTKKIMLHN